MVSWPSLLMQKSLEQLLGDGWPGKDETALVRFLAQLRKKPLGQLTSGEVCTAINQKMGLQYVVPLAVETIEAFPLVEARYYAGDMLAALARVPDGFWAEHQNLLRRTVPVVERTVAYMEREAAKSADQFVYGDILPELRSFLDARRAS